VKEDRATVFTLEKKRHRPNVRASAFQRRGEVQMLIEVRGKGGRYLVRSRNYELGLEKGKSPERLSGEQTNA